MAVLTGQFLVIETWQIDVTRKMHFFGLYPSLAAANTAADAEKARRVAEPINSAGDDFTYIIIAADAVINSANRL